MISWSDKEVILKLYDGRIREQPAVDFVHAAANKRAVITELIARRKASK